MTITHFAQDNIDQLHALLSGPKKKIGFLLGAGTSVADKHGAQLIPDTNGIITKIISKFAVDPYKTALEKVKIEIETTEKFTIESLLSRISEKERASGTEKLCNLSKSELKKFREDIEAMIREEVAVHTKPTFASSDLLHVAFANWIRKAGRETPIEIFTTNYDYCLELGLEEARIPYFDGFIGSYDAFFYPEWIEDNVGTKDWLKLWKLHGSLGWKTKDGNIVRTSKTSNEGMIYPSYLKYDHSRKQPYLSYMDRLSHFLRQEDSLLIVCGYSFGDEHINETIMTSSLRSRSAHIVVLKNGKMAEGDRVCEEIGKRNSKIVVYAKNAAVISCKYGEWKPITNEGTTSNYEFKLGDFGQFVEFLTAF